MRTANFIPIYKHGVRENSGNYRPVSLTSITGKIMVKLIERRLKNNAVIRHRQHKFTKNKVLNNLISICNKVTGLVDEGKAMDVIFPGLLLLFLTASFWTSCPTVRTASAQCTA